MLKKFKSSLLNNLKIFGLILLIIFTIIVATLSNHQKKLSKNQNNNIVDNIYFKKTLNEIVNNLEPRYKKYNHKIKSGETFDKILIVIQSIKMRSMLSNKVFQKKLI